MDLILSLITKYPILNSILMLLGTLVVIGQTYVALTPSLSDDAWLAKVEDMPGIGHLLSMLVAFAPIERKASDQKPKETPKA